MDWTRTVWRLLCLLTVITGLLAVTGVLWTLHVLLQAPLLVSCGVVMLLCAVALRADWSRSRDGSRKR